MTKLPDKAIDAAVAEFGKVLTTAFHTPEARRAQVVRILVAYEAAKRKK